MGTEAVGQILVVSGDDLIFCFPGDIRVSSIHSATVCGLLQWILDRHIQHKEITLYESDNTVQYDHQTNGITNYILLWPSIWDQFSCSRMTSKLVNHCITAFFL